MLVILMLGFSSGLPLALIVGTLSAWLFESGVSKTAIGLFALVGLPYNFKFAWAPLMDGVRVPWLADRLGPRRAWAIVVQVLLALAMASFSVLDPREAPAAVAVMALTVAFLSASQDIVVDAYRVEILEENAQGAGAAAIQLGYRIGMLASGAGALFIADAFGWQPAFIAVAALISVGVVTVLASSEPQARARPPIKGTRVDRLRLWVERFIVGPFADFMQRPRWQAILLFVILYKFGDVVAGGMANPFYLDLGFTKTEIASVTKVFGLVATLTGALAGGLVVARLGVVRGVLVCGILQMGSNLMFAALAMAGHDLRMLIVAIGAENFTGGMGTAAFVAYLSALCSRTFTATQYALLSSLAALGRSTLGSASGWLADHVDWVSFFVASTAAALPGLLLLLWLMARDGALPEPARSTA